jgi:type VI secretion system protein VasD
VNSGVLAGRARSGPARAGALALAIVAGVMLGLGGCGSPPKPPPPTTVDGAIQASPQLNLSVNQRPSPLLLRVYELKSSSTFNSADFMSLYQGDQAALAADLVAREEIMLQPGERRPYKKTLGADTKFIGVFGAYRNLEKATWRAVVPVQPNKAQQLSIRAGDLALAVEVKP